MTIFALLFTLAAIGVAQTAYLIRKRKAAEAPICPIGGDCTTVLTSKYNNLLGFVHNDVLGFSFYCAMLVLTGLHVIGLGPSELYNAIVNWSIAAASVMSLTLIYIMWRVLKAWCTWCLMSALTIFLMEIILVIEHFDLFV